MYMWGAASLLHLSVYPRLGLRDRFLSDQQRIGLDPVGLLSVGKNCIELGVTDKGRGLGRLGPKAMAIRVSLGSCREMGSSRHERTTRARTCAGDPFLLGAANRHFFRS